MRITVDKDNEISTDTVEVIVRKVSAQRYDYNLCVDSSSLRQISPRTVNVRLRVYDSHKNGARKSPTGRRTVNACWHAYRDVIREIFAEYPEATVRSGVTTYHGGRDFEASHHHTAETNVGSHWNPARLADMCECDD